MHRKHPIHALVLVMSLSLPFMVVCMWYQSQLFIAKQNALGVLEDSNGVEDTITLKLSIADAADVLSWEHEREFTFKGEMYDVFYSKEAGDSIIYYCYHDTFESELKRAYVNVLSFIARGGHPDGTQEQYTTNFFKSLFVITLTEDTNPYSAFDPGPSGMLFVNLYTDCILDLVSPPPQPFV